MIALERTKLPLEILDTSSENDARIVNAQVVVVRPPGIVASVTDGEVAS